MCSGTITISEEQGISGAGGFSKYEQERRRVMEINGLIAGIIAVVAGVLILIVPRLLSWIVAIYLIIVGVIAIIAAV